MPYTRHVVEKDDVCGTWSMYRKHKYRGEEVDDLCYEAMKAFWVERRATTPELNETRKVWRDANQGKVHGWRATRAGRISENGTENYSIMDILDRWGVNCHICTLEIDFEAPRRPGQPGWELSLHLDHVIAVSRGGSDTIDNVKPAHAKCNLEKSNREWAVDPKNAPAE